VVSRQGEFDSIWVNMKSLEAPDQALLTPSLSTCVLHRLRLAVMQPWTCKRKRTDLNSTGHLKWASFPLNSRRSMLFFMVSKAACCSTPDTSSSSCEPVLKFINPGEEASNLSRTWRFPWLYYCFYAWLSWPNRCIWQKVAHESQMARWIRTSSSCSI